MKFGVIDLENKRWAATSEANVRVKHNRANEQWWWTRCMKPRDEVIAEVVSGLKWNPLPEDDGGDFDVILAHGIGKTHYVPGKLVRISGSGRTEEEAWKPGDPIPVGFKVIYLHELTEWLSTIYEHERSSRLKRESLD